MKKEINRVIGESTAGATKLIIDYFKPDVWVIENPYQSHIWKFLINHHGLDGILNSTYYSNYDQSYSLKPTKFFSNITLNLLRNSSIRGNSKYYTYGNYNQRSNIPTKLILDIVNSSTNFINSQKEQICH
ncbi:hypothetical protein NPA07_03355 [Mycoplasmopsis caviae]|uniref:Uncharacterized protein n=1 Tax=Mycoplasmopsis caviae TaxID=55603 RepID=A0A3P8LB99_9BACT|nr:hypothetical protein [Mycoplasmopsis caviae]UUD34834.1 hypothetical protein NPA07_03355 [Mycoplasmopsis caviae]VDR42311.1 Uncharacterised protein [Mycoplasmopsis caviae]